MFNFRLPLALEYRVHKYKCSNHASQSDLNPDQATDDDVSRLEFLGSGCEFFEVLLDNFMLLGVS